ncbi:hypothetical protein [Mailhella sp.]
MSQISMESMVGMIRTFETLGEAAVVESSGKLDGRDAAQVRTDQAKANENLIRNILDDVRKTQGMGAAQVTLAEQAFGELAASGDPLQGREVAAVLTTLVHSVQMELDPEAGLKELEDFAKTLQSAPLHELDEASFSADLPRVSHEQVEAFVAANTTVESAPASLAASQTLTKIDEAVADLQPFKDAMGGAPHYPLGRPCYDADSKKFFGIPMEACQTWCRKQIENATFGKPFWTFVGKLFGVSSSPETSYERVSLYLESMKRLAANRDQIVAALREDASQGSRFLSTTTRLAAHVSTNGVDATIATIDSALGMFASQYELAKQRGKLQDFFEHALRGVCFEDRTRQLQEYAFATTFAGEEDIQQDPNLLYISPINVVEHSESDDMATALSKEIMAIRNSTPDREFSWNEFKLHFMTSLQGRTFVGTDPETGAPTGAPVAISENAIEDLHEYFRDILFIVDD